MPRYALVIGIQQYGESGFNDLTKPVEDAEAVAQILKTHGDFTVTRLPRRWNAEADDYEVTETRLTGSELGQEIRSFFETAGRNEALIYFSGHGYEVIDVMDNRSGWLVASDCSIENVGIKGLPLESLNREILKSECSSITVLLDCCHAGRLLEKSTITRSLTAFSEGERNYFLATACRGHEKAYEGPKHSLFTAAVLKALKEPGTDGRVRTPRLGQIIDEELRGSGQEPVISKSGGSITLAMYANTQLKPASRQPRELPRIRGLSSFETLTRQGPFRAYLDSGKLPYYSRSAHLSIDPSPEGIHIPNEADLLQKLQSPNLMGLIITGSGGIGKTRLMLEIGHMALAEDWLVFRVRERLKADSIEKLAEYVDSDQRILLLIDYVETQQDFLELVEILSELNEDEDLQFRYVANCRNTYYSNIKGIYQHHQVDLSPCDETIEWFERYRYETVRHILKQSEVGATDKYLDVCKNTPILAVFLAYLKSCERNVELDSLLAEDSFGQWLLKRIRLSFQVPGIERELALLIAQFPMSDESAQGIYQSEHRQLFSKLASDRWIELDQTISDLREFSSWVTIHDVLADQILTCFLEENSSTAEFFICDLLNSSVQNGCLRSTFYTLQRLVGLSLLRKLDWPKILNQQMCLYPLAWQEIRDTLLGSSLLTPSESLYLLDQHEAVCEGAESDIDFQNHLALLTRQYLREANDQINESSGSILSRWVQRVAPHVSTINPLLTWGLKLCPEAVQETAITWLAKRSWRLKTRYLLAAWLDSGLPIEDRIHRYLARWLSAHNTALEAQFVYKAWLDAGGDRSAVESSLHQWLAEHAKALEARFVYKAWLDAGGDKSAVENSLHLWLAEHATVLEADFVCKAWLDAGGDKSAVESSLYLWLAEYATALEAQFVYKSWLDAGGDRSAVESSLYQWLAEHATALEASFVYKAWLDAGGDKSAVESFLHRWLAEHATALEAQFVYKSWLDAGGDKSAVESFLHQWLAEHATALEAQFVYKSWLDAGGDKSAVESFLHRWLAEHATVLEARFVYKSWLGAGGDKSAVESFLHRWLAEHATALEADFVYKAWLDAGGNKATIEAALEQWLAEYPTAWKTDFVCKAWLAAGGDKATVETALRQWLEERSTTLDAQFIYKSWLDAGGDKSIVESSLHQWLAEHATALEASFIYQAWLDAGGDKLTVETALEQWLVEHPTSLEARFVYQAWLNAGGDTATVETALQRWLAEYPTALEASFICQAWLNSGGDKSTVETALKQWLVEHPTSLEARFVYQAWLNAGGDTATIEATLQQWLDEHSTALEASFIYQAWLNNGGNKATIETALTQWLGEHPTVLKAQFVYQAWLNIGGDIAIVETALRRWLVENSAALDLDFVCKAWLEAGGEFDVVKDFVISWLQENWFLERAVYISKVLAKQPDIPTETVRYILRWCHKFPDHEDATWRFTQLRANLFKDEVGEDVLNAAEAILSPFVESQNLNDYDMSRVHYVFSYLVASRSLQGNNFQPRVDSLVLTWLRNPVAFGVGKKPKKAVQRPPYFQRIINLITEGKLTIEADREALVRFLEWIDLWEPENKQRIYRGLDFLKHNYPDPDLWEIVQFK